MSASPSPLYASPLSSVGYSTELPAGYKIRHGRSGFEVYHDGWFVEGEFDSYAQAAFAAQDHHDVGTADRLAQAQEAAAEDAYQDELNKLYALVNAQGGYVEPEDKAGQARVRAINDVLSFIEKAA